MRMLEIYESLVERQNVLSKFPDQVKLRGPIKALLEKR